MIYLLIFIVIFLTTLGQLLLKVASKKNSIIYLSLSYIIFIIVVITSYFILKEIELKYFTAIMTINYLMVFLASSYILKETISKKNILGIFLVTMGLIIFIFGVDIDIKRL